MDRGLSNFSVTSWKIYSMLSPEWFWGPQSLSHKGTQTTEEFCKNRTLAG